MSLMLCALDASGSSAFLFFLWFLWLFSRLRDIDSAVSDISQKLNRVSVPRTPMEGLDETLRQIQGDEKTQRKRLNR